MDQDTPAARLINDIQDISFLKLALIVLGTWLIIFVVRKSFPYIAERGPSRARLYVLGAVPLIRLVLLVGAVLWIIPIVFNITFQNFLVIAGAASVAIGFAFKDYVSSLIAGTVAIFEKPYRPGDWIEIGGDYGEVQSVGMRAIRLRTPSDDIVTVPHIRLWDQNVSNGNDGTRTLMCVTDFFLAPDHDAEAVRAALRNIALTSAYLDYDRPVLVMLSETPWGTHYKLKAYPFDMRDQFAFVSDLTVRGKGAIRGAGGRQVTAPAAMADT
ncbi:mechanosensitive ion channel family protein [Jannaschia sp. S6380]|uniref:mechanosensitive ion channel family protein n=1 Tax=Jannaschia sp. S6380 TaxID=2926408 RepID=UPI001FF2AC47|nr:mechanosensitive ion channel domain-containing protein [Jannaschia sp. S6380]MCK0168377.1 mechanosensitive ion channel family protein [Jannaschia sp. S6380]